MKAVMKSKTLNICGELSIGFDDIVYRLVADEISALRSDLRNAVDNEEPVKIDILTGEYIISELDISFLYEYECTLKLVALNKQLERDVNKFFSVAIENCSLTERDIFDCIRGVTGQRIVVQECDHTGEVKNHPKKDTKTYAPKQEQPTVPIQFVWHDGYLNHASNYECHSIEDQFKNCTVEQIGAVLYVRSKG